MRFRPGTARLLASAAILLGLSCGAAFAAAGHPVPWQIGLQDAVTPLAERLHEFNALVLVIITAIVLFVTVLLGICIVRFNEKANPTPTRTTHNTLLEVLWSVVPVLVLVIIAVPSFRLLYAQYDIPRADLTIKAIGHQWFWSYEYQTAKADAVAGQPADPTAPAEFTFDSVMLKDSERKADQPRLLAVDNEVVVPVGKVVRVQTTSVDVIHAFAMPSFGIKADAVPGRLNEMWFRADREGIYYGQCSELCGRDHAFMPVAVRVVSEAAYAAWYADAKRRFADAGSNQAPSTALADAGAVGAAKE